MIEAEGSLDAARLALRLARRATRVDIFGVLVPGEIGISPKEVHFTEIRIDASFSIAPRAILKSLGLMEKGVVDPSRAITHRNPLEKNFFLL